MNTEQLQNATTLYSLHSLHTQHFQPEFYFLYLGAVIVHIIPSKQKLTAPLSPLLYCYYAEGGARPPTSPGPCSPLADT